MQTVFHVVFLHFPNELLIRPVCVWLYSYCLMNFVLVALAYELCTNRVPCIVLTDVILDFVPGNVHSIILIETCFVAVCVCVCVWVWVWV